MYEIEPRPSTKVKLGIHYKMDEEHFGNWKSASNWKLKANLTIWTSNLIYGRHVHVRLRFKLHGTLLRAGCWMAVRCRPKMCLLDLVWGIPVHRGRVSCTTDTSKMHTSRCWCKPAFLSRRDTFAVAIKVVMPIVVPQWRHIAKRKTTTAHIADLKDKTWTWRYIYHNISPNMAEDRG